MSTRIGSPGQSPDLVAALVHRAAMRGEAATTLARIAFCILGFARFAAIDVPRARVTWVAHASISALALGFSSWMLWRVRRARVSRAMLAISVLLDVWLCALALLGTLLWHGPLPFPGLFTQPDVQALTLVVFAAGLRLDPRLVLLAGATALAAASGLRLLEHQLYPAIFAYGITQVSFVLLGIVSGAAVAALMAARTRSLATAAARDSLRLQRARADVLTLMRDQHDARSLLSAAVLQADLVDRTLGTGATAGNAERMVQGLREDLRLASRLIETVAERTFGQLMHLEPPRPLDPAAVLADTIPALRRRFPSLTICPEIAACPAVALLGGRASLERILSNLVANAVQGHGGVGAATVRLRCLPSARGSVVEITDDGPGFPSVWLAGGALGGASAKRDGTGLGLLGVASLVQASGGTLLMDNPPDGGARVRLELVAADTSPRQKDWPLSAALPSATPGGGGSDDDQRLETSQSDPRSPFSRRPEL